MNATIADGVWPTMVTPFTEDNRIDYDALERMIDWFISQGVHGLFAVCQSSEMFFLSLEERIELARFVCSIAAGRIPVIVSGNIAEALQDQAEEIKRISDSGAKAFVLVSNRLAAPEQSECVWKKNAEELLRQVPEVDFGIYECPYPYKRVLSPELLRWCADTGRFLFLKDTCSDPEMIGAKIEAVRGTRLKLYNANAATLLDSLKRGAAGYSGVMANFHPDLYVKLIEGWSSRPEEAEALQSFLGVASVIERQLYPTNAKYHLQLEGLPIRVTGRSVDATGFTAAMKMEVRQLHSLARLFRR